MIELIIVLATLLILVFILKDKSIKQLTDWNDKTTNNEEKAILFCWNFVNKYPKQFITETEIKTNIILTTLMFQEAGTQVLSKKNEQIRGLFGEIGYFQIRNIALQDVNKYFGGNYNYNDLYNEAINLLIASRYFYLCFNKNNNGKDFYEKLWLASKRYNGGRDETLKSKNAQAEKYANNFLKNYSKVENILRKYDIL